MAKQQCILPSCSATVEATHESELPHEMDEHLQAEHGTTIGEYVGELRQRQDDLEAKIDQLRHTETAPVKSVNDMRTRMYCLRDRIEMIETVTEQYGLME